MISFEQEQDKSTGLDFAPDPTKNVTTTVSPETAQRRAYKADFALGSASPGMDILREQFWSGHEDQMREYAAAQEGLQRQKAKRDIITSLARQAAAEGRSLSAQEASEIQALSAEELENPETVLEKQYARRLVQTSAIMDALSDFSDRAQGLSAVSDFAEAMEFNPNEANGALDGAERVATQQEIAQRGLEDLQQRYDNTSWARWGYDFAKTLVPFYTWTSMVGAIEGMNAPSWLPGNNLAEQIEGLYLLPPDEFKAAYTRAVNEMADYNMVDAMQFAQAVVTYSTSDRVWDNVFGGMDIADVAITVGTAGVGKAALSAIARRLRSTVSANAVSKATAADVIAASGNLKAAAQQKVLSRLADLNPEDGFVGQQIEAIAKTQKGLLDPTTYFRAPGSLANEAANRLQDSLDEVGRTLFRTLDKTSTIDRTGEAAAQIAFENAEKGWRKRYHYLEDAVLDIVPQRLSTETFGGVDTLNIYLGDHRTATAFKDKERAINHAKNIYGLQDGTYEPVFYNGNWVLRMQKTVDETELRVREARVGTDGATPKNFMNTWLGALRSADDVLSARETETRKVATHGGNEVVRLMQQAAKGIGALSKKEMERHQKVLIGNRFEKRTYLMPDGSKQELQGNWYDNVAELEQAYKKYFGVLPNEKEVGAYFTYRMIADYDYVSRNIAMIRDKYRLGVEQHSLGLKQGNSDWFEGRTVDSLPGYDSEPWTVAWQNTKTGDWHFQQSDKLRMADKAELEKRIADGKFQPIQLTDGMDETIQNLVKTGGARVDYVIGVSQTKPLNPVQVGYRGAGHIMYPDQGVYIKQANTWNDRFGNVNYGGDTTVHYFPSGKQAQRFLKAYEDFRQAMVAGASDKQLKKLLKDLPYQSVAEVKKLFRQKGKKGTEDAPFSLDVPFVVAKSGQRAGDAMDLRSHFGRSFVDLGNSEHNLMRNVSTRFTQERSDLLTTVTNVGTEDAPMFNLTPAPMLDPIEALSRSATGLMRSRFYDDYKHQSVENWGTQFAHLLKTPVDQVNADPMRALREPVWKDGINADEKAAALNNRRAILQLLGTENDVAQKWQWMKDKIADQIIERLGDSPPVVPYPKWLVGSKTVRGMLQPWEWKANSNPVQMLRGLTFHAKLGLWNPVQLFLQSQTIIHSMAIDPVNAPRAVLAAWMMRGLRMGEHNPEFASALGKASRKALGIPEDVFDEMYRAMRMSGIDNVEGEVAQMDNYFNPSLVRSKAGWVLDSSKIFFQEGERMVRMTGFNTAFLAWRKANPTAKLTKPVINQLTARADLLALNMTRASNAPAWQGGVGFASQLASIPTQFWTYQVRLTEQMLGGRLTGAEKARLMLVYSAMYGVPVGVVGTSLGAAVPAYDLYREDVLKRGADVQSNPLIQAIHEGLPQVILEALTRTELNVAERYGPGGLTWFSDIKEGKGLDVLFGASGSFLMDVIENFEPFTASLVSLFDPKANDILVPTPEDFLDVFKEISTINNMTGMYLALNYGKFYTQNEVAIADVDKWGAIMRGALGLVPQDVADAFIMSGALFDQSQHKKTLEKEAQKYYMRGLRAFSTNDKEEGLANWNKARAILVGSGYTPPEITNVFTRFQRSGGQNYVEQIGKDFVIKSPAEYREQRMKRWQDRHGVNN